MQVHRRGDVSFREPEKYKSIFNSQLKRAEFKPTDGLQQNPEIELANSLCRFYQSKQDITLLTQDGREATIETLYTDLKIIEEDEKKAKINKGEKKSAGEAFGSQKDREISSQELAFEPEQPIAINELFKHSKLNGINKKVAILGSAGSGKSILCHHIAYMWAKKELFQEFDYVFWLRLRRLNERHYSKDSSLADYLAKECEIKKDTVQSYLGNKDLRHKTLFLLDGHDELSHAAANEDGSLHHIIKELKAFPNVVITSRPSIISNFKPVCRLEILGFDSKGIENYIQHFFSNQETEKAKALREYLKHPLYQSLAHTPINIEIFCSLAAANKLFSSPEPPTMTSIYWSLTDWLFKRFKGKQPDTNPDNVLEEPNTADAKDVQPLAEVLEKIAWEAVSKNTLYISKTEITKICSDVDTKIDIQSIKKAGLMRIEKDEGVFIHPTFQEYFAAAWLSRLYKISPTEAKNYVREIKFEPHYRRVLYITAGLLSRTAETLSLQRFFDDLFAEPYDLGEHYELNLLAQCFEECDAPQRVKQHTKFVEKITSYLQDNFEIGAFEIGLLYGNHKLLHHPQLVEMIIKGLEDHDSKMFILLLVLVREQQPLPPKIVKFLLDFCADEGRDPWMRDVAVGIVLEIAEAGGNLGSQALLTLLSILKEPSLILSTQSKRKIALKFIASRERDIGSELLTNLTRMVRDSSLDFSTRERAAYSLGEIALKGKDTSFALASLIDMMQDLALDVSIRRGIVDVLKSIAQTEGNVGSKALGALIRMVKDDKVIADRYRKYEETIIRSNITSKLNTVWDFPVQRRAALALQPLAKKEEKVGPINRIQDFLLNIATQKVKICALKIMDKIRGEEGAEVYNSLLSMETCSSLNIFAQDKAACALGAIAVKDITIKRKNAGIEALTFLIDIARNSSLSIDVQMEAIDILETIVKAEESMGSKALEALLNMVKDLPLFDNFFILPYVISSLGRIAGRRGEVGDQTLAALIDIMKDTALDISIREMAVSSFRIIDKGRHDQLLADFLNLAKDSSLDVQSLVCVLKNTVEKGIELSAILRNIVKDSLQDTVLRKEAVSVLRDIAREGKDVGAETLAILINVAKDSSQDIVLRKDAACALGDITMAKGDVGSEALTILISMAKDFLLEQNDWREIFFMHLKGFAQAGDDLSAESLSSLIEVVKEFSPLFDGKPFEVLGIIAKREGDVGEQALAALISMAKDSFFDYHWKAAYTLADIAIDGKDIGSEGIPILINMLKNSWPGAFTEQAKVFLKGIIASRENPGFEETKKPLVVSDASIRSLRNALEVCHITGCACFYDRGKIYQTDKQKKIAIRELSYLDNLDLKFFTQRVKHWRL